MVRVSFELNYFVIISIIVVVVGLFIKENQFLLKQLLSTTTPSTSTSSSLSSAEYYYEKQKKHIKFTVITNNILLDTVLEYHKNTNNNNDNNILKDTTIFIQYRNHCYRILSLAQYYYQEQIILLKEQQQQEDDTSKNKNDWNQEQQSVVLTKRQLQVLVLGIAYHDMSLFVGTDSTSITTKNTNDYIELSISIMMSMLTEERQQYKWYIRPDFTMNELQIIQTIIQQHYKMTEYTTLNNQNQKDNNNNSIVVSDEYKILINAVRVSYWTDITYGTINVNTNNNVLTKSIIEQVYDELPDVGYHNQLLTMGFNAITQYMFSSSSSTASGRT